MGKVYMYILKCGNGKYYTGSTKYIDQRLEEHVKGLGSNYTSEHGVTQLVYFEEFDRIDDAYNREQQIKKWSQSKKKALIESNYKALRKHSECKNKTHFKNKSHRAKSFSFTNCI